MNRDAQAYLERMDDVPGWFTPLDAMLFSRLFEAQHDAGVQGDSIEIGCWFGRCAILLGFLKREHESLHVCDLFGDTPTTKAGRAEHCEYSGVQPSRSDFEAWYRTFHTALPTIHHRPASALNAAELGSSQFRFAHIDGSHTYEAVTQDVATACEIATEGGVVAVDDFANVNYLGVAAAVWPAVMEGRLEPFASSPDKLYTTVGSDAAALYRAAIQEFASARGNPSKVCELPETALVSVWPKPEGRNFGAKVMRRLRRARGRNPQHTAVTVTGVILLCVSTL